MAKYNPDFAATSLLMTGPKMVALMVAHAEPVKTVAEGISPVETGEYKGAFDIESGVVDEHGLRAYADVVNNSPHAQHVEWGDGNTPRHRVLGRALGVA